MWKAIVTLLLSLEKILSLFKLAKKAYTKNQVFDQTRDALKLVKEKKDTSKLDALFNTFKR